VEHHRHVIVILHREVPVKRWLEAEEPMIDPSVEWTAMNYESAWDCQLMRRFEELKNIEHVLGRAGIDGYGSSQ
jgi:hypothetical protein